MQYLEDSCVVRPIYLPLGVKWLKNLKDNYLAYRP